MNDELREAIDGFSEAEGKNFDDRHCLIESVAERFAAFLESHGWRLTKGACKCTADEVKGKGYTHCHYCGRPIAEAKHE